MSWHRTRVWSGRSRGEASERSLGHEDRPPDGAGTRAARLRRLGLGALALLLAPWIGCGDPSPGSGDASPDAGDGGGGDSTTAGVLGAPCLDDGTCLDDLLCVEGVCSDALPAPEGLEAESLDESIALRWEHVDLDGVEFEVSRREVGDDAFSVLAPTTAGATEWVDERILLGKTYEYRVRATLGALSSDYSATVEGRALEEPAAWTLIYFISSDGDYPGYTYWFNVEEMERQGGSSESVNVLVLYDGYERGDSRYYLVGDSPSSTEAFEIPGDDENEVNMGDVSAYATMADWMFPRFTAEHYLVSFHDHGGGAIELIMGGRKSMLFDETSWDALDADEQGEVVAYLAARAEQKMDVVESMTCLGQMVENTYGMIDHARYHVGAESLSYVTLTFPIDFLEANPDAGGEDVARYITNDHIRGVEAIDSPCHWSMIDLDRLGALADLLAELASRLSLFIEGPEQSELLRDLVGRAQSFGYDAYSYTVSYVDVADMAVQLRDEPSLPEDVRDVAGAIVEAFDTDLVPITGYHNAHHPGTDVYGDYSETHGLSIYHPSSNRPAYDEVAYPPYESFAFCEATGWDDYLRLVSLGD